MPYGTLNVDKIVNDNGVTFAGLYGFKNRIINGAMMIDQRNAGASVTVNDQIVLDRFACNSTQASRYSAQRNQGSVTPPAGFSNYLGTTSLSAYSVLSTDWFGIQQVIEGFNIADLGWGTANAQAVTISFWVRSSLTGAFGGSLRNGGVTRSYPFTYTISAANTWEFKTITIAGDTSGTWATDNTGGIRLTFGLGVGTSLSGTAGAWSGSNLISATGAVSVVGTNGATFYITGVQLEKGSTATSFDFRPYGTEFMLCQRYYWRTDPGTTSQYLTSFSASTSTGTLYVSFTYPSFMRSNPTITAVLGSDVSGVSAVGAGTIAINNVRLDFTRTAASGYYSLNSLQASAEL